MNMFKRDGSANQFVGNPYSGGGTQDLRGAQQLGVPPISDFAPRPKVKPLSEHAAEVAQNIEALHKEVEQLTRERDQLRQEALALRSELEREKAAHEVTTALKEAYQRHSLSTRAKLDMIGQNVLTVLNEPGPEGAAYPGPNAQQLADLERAVTAQAAE